MAVKIDIDLNAGDTVAQIGAIATSLKGLEQVADDVDINFDADIGEISDEINKFSQALEDIDVGDINFVQELDKVAEKLDDAEIKHNFNFPDGSTGDGDSSGNDPPTPGGGTDPNKGESFSVSDFTFDISDVDTGASTTSDGGDKGGSGFEKSKIFGNMESLLGYETGELQDMGVDDQRLKEISSNIEHSTRSLTDDDAFNLGPNALSADFFSEKEDFSEMPWQELQQKASEENVYTADATREELESRLRSQRFTSSNRVIRDGFGFEPGDNRDKRFEELTEEERAEIRSPDVGFSDVDRRGPLPDGPTSFTSTPTNLFENERKDLKTQLNPFRSLGKGSEMLGKKFRKFRPTMGKYMQLLAAMLPVAVALGTQLLGVAAAMGSVAGAGASLIGLGLIGHGESMAGSFAQAKQQVKSLKAELFRTFQPTAQKFAPIQAKAFDRIPQMLEPIAEKMEGLTAYEDTLFQLGNALAGGIERATAFIVENEKAISQLTTRFAGLLGSGALKFFEFLTKSAKKNQGLIVSLGSDLLRLAVVAYNLSMAVAKVVTSLTPFFTILAFISKLLNSDLIIGLVTMITYLFVIGKAAGLVYMLGSAFLSLAGFISDASLIMLGYEMSTWGAVAATLALVSAIGLLTLGASTAIGAAVTGSVMSSQDIPSGGSGGSSGGKQTVYNDNRSYTINNNGKTDYADKKKIEQTVRRINGKNEATALPKPSNL